MSVKGRLIARYKGDWEPTVLIEDSSWGHPTYGSCVDKELYFQIAFPDSANKAFWTEATRVRVGTWYCDNPSARR